MSAPVEWWLVEGWERGGEGGQDSRGQLSSAISGGCWIAPLPSSVCGCEIRAGSPTQLS